MKAFIIYTFILIAGYTLGVFCLNGKNFNKFMSRDYTSMLKGIAILTVVWAHTGAALNVRGIQFIAGMGVALFLICSGYGLEVSYEQKGLHGFWGKRFLKICIPYWLATLGGLSVQKAFSPSAFFNNIAFLKPGVGNWFIKYIIICYLLFYVLKTLCDKIDFFKQYEIILLFSLFAIWFMLDSTYFSDSIIPFLKARQMLSFPFGILIAKYKNQLETRIISFNNTIKVLCTGFMAVGIIFMGITQLPQVKSLPYVVYNIMALATVLPLSLAVIILVAGIPKLFNNSWLIYCGVISYELFLIHPYTMVLIKPSLKDLLVFTIFTLVSSAILHWIDSKIANIFKTFSRLLLNILPSAPR